MDYKLITVKEYQHLLEKLNGIESTLKEKMNPEKKIYSTEDLCNLLGVSPRTVQKWRTDKAVEYSQINNKIFYSWTQIQAFLENHKA